MTAPDLPPVDLFDVESRLPEEARLARRSMARFVDERFLPAHPAKLVEMWEGIVKGQLLALRLGELEDEGRATHLHVSMGKRAKVRMARGAARVAREILGANGVVDDYPVIRHMLNMEAVYTYEGTHDIHTLVLGHHITGIPAYE